MNEHKIIRDRSNERAQSSLKLVAVDVRRLTTKLQKAARLAGLVYAGGLVLIDAKYMTAPSMAWRVWSNEGECADEKFQLVPPDEVPGR